MGGASSEQVKAAELELSVIFAPDYHEYVKAFGAASFAGHELTGVCTSKRLNVVTVTQEERKSTSVPLDWYVIEQANIDGIVIWQTASGVIYQTTPNGFAKELCKSLSEYVEL